MNKGAGRKRGLANIPIVWNNFDLADLQNQLLSSLKDYRFSNELHNSMDLVKNE